MSETSARDSHEAELNHEDGSEKTSLEARRRNDSDTPAPPARVDPQLNRTFEQRMRLFAKTIFEPLD
jgi:hypothetical protein